MRSASLNFGCLGGAAGSRFARPEVGGQLSSSALWFIVMLVISYAISVSRSCHCGCEVRFLPLVEPRDPRDLGHESLPRGRQSRSERFARDILNERTDQPAQARRNVACERNCFALNIDPTIELFEAPVGVQTPEEAVVFADRLFVLPRSVRVSHFGNAGAVGATVGAPGVNCHVADVIFGVEHRCEHLCSLESQKYAEFIAGTGEQFRAFDLGRVMLSRVVIVLDQSKRVAQRYAGNENDSHPVVNEAAPDTDSINGIAGF